jgi:carboxypeptidase Q
MKVFLFLLASCAIAQTVDREMNAKIRAEGMNHSQAAQVFEKLAIEIGPRLTASPAFDRALAFVRDRMSAYGLDNVHPEPFQFARGWSLEHLTVEMTEPRYTPLIAYADAWSPAVSVEAAPIYLGGKSPEQIEGMRASLKGAIVLAQPMPTAFLHEDRVQPTAPGITPPQVLSAHPMLRANPQAQRITQIVRDAGPAAIVRTSVLADGTLMAGGRDGATIPTIDLSAEHYNTIARMIEHGLPVKLHIDLRTRFYPTDGNAYSVIGEIPGGDRKDEIVMLGAHVDSWHAAQGATDNADGVATMLEAMRILKAAGARPRRTIRLATWGGEEQGLLGSKAWVAAHLAGDAHREERDKFSVYFNIDNGTGPIYGFALENNESARAIFDAWLEPFKDLGARKNVNLRLNSTDHESFNAAGVPGFNPFQNYQDYDVRTHHTNMDTADHVSLEDLKQAAIVMASFAWHAAMLDQRFPRN